MSRYQKSLVFLSCINAGLAVLRGKSAWFAIVPLVFGVFIAVDELIHQAIQRHLKSRYDAGERPSGLDLFSAKNREIMEANFERMANGKGSIVGRNLIDTGFLLLQILAVFG